MSKSRIHFQVSERKLLLRAMDLIMVVFGLYILQFFSQQVYVEISWENHVAIGILLFYIGVFGTVFEAYDLQKSSKLDASFNVIVLTVSTSLLFYFLTPIWTPFLPEKRLQIVYFFITIISAIFLWRTAYITLIASPRFYKRVLMVGEIAYVDSFVKALRQADPNYKIVGFINGKLPKTDTLKLNGIKEFGAHQLFQAIKEENISEVVVASYSPEIITVEIYNNLMTLLEKGIAIREYTQVYEEVTYQVPIQFIGKDFYRYFPFSRSNQNKLYQFFHRVFDLLISCVGMVFGILILPIILMGNLLGNRGPLLYTQSRVGKNGKTFNIIKLRSMIVNAETDGAKWAQPNDVRVTRFGKFLRHSRIDEIPQFINIIKGDMSVIGPRPERPFFVNELSKIIPFYETRHIIKPGLTGWAQVKTRYGSSVEESRIKLQYDLFYIKHRSVFLDLNIMVKTLSTVLYYRGQ